MRGKSSQVTSGKKNKGYVLPVGFGTIGEKAIVDTTNIILNAISYLVEIHSGMIFEISTVNALGAIRIGAEDLLNMRLISKETMAMRFLEKSAPSTISRKNGHVKKSNKSSTPTPKSVKSRVLRYRCYN